MAAPRDFVAHSLKLPRVSLTFHFAASFPAECAHSGCLNSRFNSYTRLLIPVPRSPVQPFQHLSAAAKAFALWLLSAIFNSLADCCSSHIQKGAHPAARLPKAPHLQMGGPGRNGRGTMPGYAGQRQRVAPRFTQLRQEGMAQRARGMVGWKRKQGLRRLRGLEVPAQMQATIGPTFRDSYLR
jgi:hypothetical protein